MSLSATNYVFQRRYGNQTRKLLMIAIADFANDRGEAWPAIDTLAARAECSRRSVQEHLAVLEKAGDLIIAANAGPRGTHRYRIVFRKTEAEECSDEGVQDLHPPCKSATPKPHEGGANGRRPSAPESSGTVRELPEREEGAALAADLVANVNNLRREWGEVAGWTAAEKAMGWTNRECLESIRPETWNHMREYLRERHPQGSGAWMVKSRLKFLEHPGDLATKASDWRRKNPVKLAVVPDPKPPSGPQSAEDAAALAEFLKKPEPKRVNS